MRSKIDKVVFIPTNALEDRCLKCVIKDGWIYLPRGGNNNSRLYVTEILLRTEAVINPNDVLYGFVEYWEHHGGWKIEVNEINKASKLTPLICYKKDRLSFGIF